MNNRKFTVLLALLCMMVALPFSASAKGKAEIKFEEETYNFGIIPEKKGVVSHEFTFTNTGTAPLIIVDATAECGCTTPEFPTKPIMPGAKGKIKVTYNPLGRPGGFTKGVTIRSNGKPRKARIYIKGVVNPNK